MEFCSIDPSAAPGSPCTFCQVAGKGLVKSLLIPWGPVGRSLTKVELKPCLCYSVNLWLDLDTALVFPPAASTQVLERALKKSQRHL